MNLVLPIADCRLPIERQSAAVSSAPIVNRKLASAKSGSEIVNDKAFTLVEIMVVMTLLSIIILSLMTVLNSTQTAFRAGLTQTDVLASGRTVTDLIKSDLETMTPSFGASNGAVNFYVTNVSLGYPTNIQSLPGSGSQRTNVLQNFFILTRQNRTWTGVGYVVDTASQPTNSLYRFSMSTNVMATDPCWWLFYFFTNAVANNNFTNMSHLMDGVVNLRVRVYDTNGIWMNYTYTNAPNFRTSSTVCGETGFYMFSNMLPASVEVELGVLEDRTLQRAESLSGAVQMAYLSNHVGQVHIFRQRVWIRNVDPSAYQ